MTDWRQTHTAEANTKGWWSWQRPAAVAQHCRNYVREMKRTDSKHRGEKGKTARGHMKIWVEVVRRWNSIPSNGDDISTATRSKRDCLLSALWQIFTWLWETMIRTERLILHCPDHKSKPRLFRQRSCELKALPPPPVVLLSLENENKQDKTQEENKIHATDAVVAAAAGQSLQQQVIYACLLYAQSQTIFKFSISHSPILDNFYKHFTSGRSTGNPSHSTCSNLI